MEYGIRGFNKNERRKVCDLVSVILEMYSCTIMCKIIVFVEIKSKYGFLLNHADVLILNISFVLLENS